MADSSQWTVYDGTTEAPYNIDVWTWEYVLSDAYPGSTSYPGNTYVTS